MHYFEITAVYDRWSDNGNIKTVKENYVVNAESCTGAEKRAVSELTPFAWDTLPEICSCKWADFSEVVHSDASADNIFWKVKIDVLTIDERSGKEKATKMCYLVLAETAVKAKTSLDEHLASSTMDYKVTGIVEAKIMDVFEKEDKDE